MKLLLDTCVYLWVIGLPERLPASLKLTLQDADVDVAVSVVSLWEILIKHGKGQIELATEGRAVLAFLLEQCAAHGLEVLPLLPGDLSPLVRLPPIHRDPFDRLLICQTIEQGLALVTPDAAIRLYPIKTIWD